MVCAGTLVMPHAAMEYRLFASVHAEGVKPALADHLLIYHNFDFRGWRHEGDPVAAFALDCKNALIFPGPAA